jgi:hypothetical protein
MITRFLARRGGWIFFPRDRRLLGLRKFREPVVHQRKGIREGPQRGVGFGAGS